MGHEFEKFMNMYEDKFAIQVVGFESRRFMHINTYITKFEKGKKLMSQKVKL